MTAGLSAPTRSLVMLGRLAGRVIGGLLRGSTTANAKARSALRVTREPSGTRAPLLFAETPWGVPGATVLRSMTNPISTF